MKKCATQSSSPVQTTCVSADAEGLAVAARVLNAGGVAVIPTDTVYGLAARPDFPAAVQRLYTIKGRAERKPIALLAADADAAARFVGAAAADVGRRHWPGALTVVAQGEGVRVPDHAWTRRLIAACGGALRVTSANLSGQRAATDAPQALADVGLSADLVVDDGVSPGGVPSTVARVAPDGTVEILRPGPVSFNTFGCTYRTPDGFADLKMSSDGTALTGLWFDGSRNESKRVAGGRVCNPELPVFYETRRWLDIFFSGRQPDFTPVYRLVDATPFREEVVREMLEIPFGATATYGEIAAKIAKRHGLARMSAQAVGGAVGWNPICLIIPCHRVVGAHGVLTGYGGGIQNKEALLALETRGGGSRA